jgi:DNA-directed RNA polymerase specialized sigma24 family protein
MNAPMSLAPPRPDADEPVLVAQCLGGDDDAWDTLWSRYRRLIQTVVVRTVDERRGGPLDEVPSCVGAVARHIKNDALALWRERSSLRCYLVVIARARTREHLEDVTPPGTLIASLPTPASLFLDEVLAEEPAKRVIEVLERMPPNVSGFVRLRLRGMDRAAIGTTLGMTAETVRGHLERVASRLAEITSDEEAKNATERAWRMLLDAAPTGERVEIAKETLENEAFRRVRSVVESTYRAVRDRELLRLHPKQTECLDEAVTAAFVDGSLRGPERTRAEGHVGTCPRCIDVVASCSLDMRTVEYLRDASEMSDEIANAAACIATTRFRAGESLAMLADATGDERGKSLVRLARIGAMLIGGQRFRAPEPSRVIATRLPTDEEAPLVALEALAQDDAHAAARAIDDKIAKGPLGSRLRLLANAAGEDLTVARRQAEELRDKPHSDPGLMTDAEAILALPTGAALPREILVERLRDTLPSAVRYVLTH